MKKKQSTSVKRFRPGRNGGKLLIPEKGGPSPNPAGRPPGKNISSILNKLLEGTIDITDLAKNTTRKVTRKEAIALQLVTLALSNSVPDTVKLRAIENIQDRTEGKVKQNIDLTTDGESIRPINTVVRDQATKKELDNLR